MPSDLIVRAVARTDYMQWLPLWDGYNAFYGRAGETALADEVTGRIDIYVLVVAFLGFRRRREGRLG